MADGGLKNYYKKYLPQVDWQPVETGGTSKGVPDVNYCRQACEGWIENKATDSFKVKMRPEQVGWLERRARAGGRAFIAVRQRGPGRDVLWLLSHEAARLLIDGARLDALPAHVVLGRWSGGAANWNWADFLSLITGPRTAPF